MKCLFVGVYRDGTGWAQSAIDYILAMDSAGVDVVCRPLKLNSHCPTLPERILELEAKSSRGCDAVIQNVLPHQAVYHGKFKKNICLFYSETSDFSSSTWGYRLSQMDEVWVANYQQTRACLMSSVNNTRIGVMPIPCDLSRYENPPPPLPLIEKQDGEYIFYSIGEFVRRKNWGGLLKAYMTEFSPSDPVRLVIKTSVPGMSDVDGLQEITRYCQGLQHELKLKKIPQVTILTRRLNEEEMMGLHSAGDCFVTASHGEAWCLPAFDAMAMGKECILPDSTGFKDWAKPEITHLIPTNEDIVFGANDTFADLYTGRETWQSPSLPYLKQALYLASQGELRNDKASGQTQARKFDYQTVGSQIHQALLMKRSAETDSEQKANSQGVETPPSTEDGQPA